MKHYVIVQEESGGDGQRGVEAVYAGPGGAGMSSWEAGLAMKALTKWLGETGQTQTRVMTVQLGTVPDRPRDLMTRAVTEAEADQRARLDESRAVGSQASDDVG